MRSCPDCVAIEDQLLARSNEFEVIDIGARACDLKAFLQLRDRSAAFACVRARGTIGIPCFVREDGSVTFRLSEVGLVKPSPRSASARACSLDGSGC